MGIFIYMAALLSEEALPSSYIHDSPAAVAVFAAEPGLRHVVTLFQGGAHTASEGDEMICRTEVEVQSLPLARTWPEYAGQQRRHPRNEGEPA